MSADLNQQLAQLKNESQSRARLEKEHADAREALMQVESRMRGVELYLEQARDELKQLEGTSLTGLVYGLLGKKGDRLEKAREACAELERQYEECAETMPRLEQTVADLERELEQVGNADEEYQRLLAEKQEQLESVDGDHGSEFHKLAEERESVESAIKDISKAIKAGEEALSDLHDEMEIVSTLGRCQVVDARGALRSLMNTSRHKTAGDCAGRVRQSLGRFHRKLNDVISKYGPDAEGNLKQIDDTLDRVSNEFAASWLKDAYTEEQSAEYVERQLQTANMLLEQKMTATRQQADSIEERRKALIENA